MEDNPFILGQKVVCISDDFPGVRTSDPDKSIIGRQAKYHPHKDDVLIIDDIIGPYLNFEKYNTAESNQWFHYTRFAPVLEEGIEAEANEVVREELLVFR